MTVSEVKLTVAVRRFALGFAAFCFVGIDQVAAAATVAPSQRIGEAISIQLGKEDYLQAKLAIDSIVDPSFSKTVVTKELDQLAAAARVMAGPSASDAVKLAALRKVIYSPGPWNGNRPFSYDHADPLGQNVRNKLLSTYLRTRRGNCVSMPTLFVVLARKLDLNVAFASAPLHVLVRYTDPTGKSINLEATSGANLTRDAWYREKMPMSDRAVENGVYLRTLSREEGMAEMATTVVEHLTDAGRHQEAIEVADVILKHAPRNAYAMVRRGTAAAAILKADFFDKYPTPGQIPVNLVPRYRELAQMNNADFEAAEALGWEPAA